MCTPACTIFLVYFRTSELICRKTLFFRKGGCSHVGGGVWPKARALLPTSQAGLSSAKVAQNGWWAIWPLIWGSWVQRVALISALHGFISS